LKIGIRFSASRLFSLRNLNQAGVVFTLLASAICWIGEYERWVIETYRRKGAGRIGRHAVRLAAAL
jgi:hypothetical protein